MDICPPAIVTSACFVAIILLDLYLRDWRRAPGHALFGVFAVLLMIFICQRGSETMAWILLASPFVLIFLAWIFRAWADVTKHDGVPEQIPAWGGNQLNAYDCPCPCCGMAPCHCMRPCPQPPVPKCKPKPKSKCRPKNKPCYEDSYFELWLTTK
jgi:hypothetical protein